MSLVWYRLGRGVREGQDRAVNRDYPFGLAALGIVEDAMLIF